MENFIHTFQLTNLKLCDDLIEYHKSNTEYKFQGVLGSGKKTPTVNEQLKKSTDVCVLPHSNDVRIKQYFTHLQEAYLSYTNKYKFCPKNVHTLEPLNIQHYKKSEGYKVWHFERSEVFDVHATRALVFMTYLNDVDDGGTEFYYQKYKTPAIKGLTLIWPSDFTHTHRGIVSHTKEKYIATGWFNLV